jgi:thioredoxin-dependent peroxiredoxin
MAIDIGKMAPDFKLKTDGGGEVSLKSLRGQKIVLYFYPKDDTSGCTREACDFRDAMARIEKAGATVIGVSPDNVERHDKFKAKYDLPFRLAADVDHKVALAYGVWVEKSMYGRKYMGIDRSTFLIDGEGRLARIWSKVKVPGHVEEVLAALRSG